MARWQAGHGGQRDALDAREAANTRHAAINEQQVSHMFRAGDDSGHRNRADKHRRVVALGCTEAPVTEFEVGVDGDYTDNIP